MWLNIQSSKFLFGKKNSTIRSTLKLFGLKENFFITFSCFRHFTIVDEKYSKITDKSNNDWETDFSGCYFQYYQVNGVSSLDPRENFEIYSFLLYSICHSNNFQIR